MWRITKLVAIFFVILLISFAGFYLYSKHYISDTKKDNNIQNNNENSEIQSDSFSTEEKISQLKKRLNFRSIIRKWDFYSIKNMKETALQYYLNAYRKLKNDHTIEKKIADTYFELKNFQKAYDYYKKIPSSERDAKISDKMLKSLMYTWNKNMRDELNNVSAPKEAKDYYDKVLVCYTWIVNCLNEFKSYSWSTEKVNTIKNDILEFEKVLHTDSNSKYAMLAWDFMKNNDYLAAALIAQETVKKRPNYTSALKIAWFAWYELWEYKKSNEFLQRYYNIEPKDVTVTYLLWIINFYLENYITSNLYLNAAVLNWYTPKNELQKRLAYNYYIIWDKKNMLKVFRYILAEDDSTPEDYGVALYTSIEDKEYSKSMLWANKWVQKFPESDMLYAFRWWLYRLRWENDNALKDLNLAISMNPRNAIALYNFWIIAMDQNKFDASKKYFEGVIEADKNWTFWDDAETRLKELEKKQKEMSSSWQTISNWN